MRARLKERLRLRELRLDLLQAPQRGAARPIDLEGQDAGARGDGDGSGERRDEEVSEGTRGERRAARAQDDLQGRAPASGQPGGVLGPKPQIVHAPRIQWSAPALTHGQSSPPSKGATVAE